MSALTIRNLDDDTKQALRMQAARKGVSLEEEVRSLLRKAAKEKEQPRKFDNLYDAIRDLVEPHGGFDDFEIPDRSFAERDPLFKEWP